MEHDYLIHHGIQGQKWGQQNGPPYPLDKSDYSAAERKAINIYSKAKKASNKAEKYEEKAKSRYDKTKKLHASDVAASVAQRNTQAKYERKYDEQLQSLTKTQQKAVEKFVTGQYGKTSSTIFSSNDVAVGQRYLESNRTLMYVTLGVVGGVPGYVVGSTVQDVVYSRNLDAKMKE